MPKQKGLWVIVNTGTEIDDETNEPLYWNRKMGWVDKSMADKYTTTQIKRHPYPPTDSKFVRYAKTKTLCAKGYHRRNGKCV